MKKTLTAERRNKLAQILLTSGSVRVGELAELFHVSTETIRKDIIYLDKEGIAKKSHGGAMAAMDTIERPVSVKEFENTEKKAKIAAKALDLIPANGTILLDTGSTIYALAKLLTLKRGLTIFTNSLNTAILLTESDNKIYTFGGSVRKSSYGIVGHWADDELSSISLNIAFLGTDGFQNSTGPCSTSFSEADFKKRCVERSRQTAILTDSSKFSINSIYKIADWDDIDYLVTDTDAPKNIRDIIGNNTEILYSE
ncbi:DeoR/GlpR family DNA-binding transcription regulator [Faecalicatena contorta]|uniref:Transcriptional regulator, DeoR family n=1 Tax=Faecalicatena contorta TaxID=39482 RepID=A0A315ZVA5_9FIRM|nr:DeoR/GlpR family DNA-binding transcription regulator [Faecalicatena contorta]PWJ48574.1 DeoR family transcriptional regulator [Faecalicatena contorta]SUQ15310.1 transcriptional regulator, DeoR family [Faecalicatena contorta]